MSDWPEKSRSADRCLGESKDLATCTIRGKDAGAVARAL